MAEPPEAARLAQLVPEELAKRIRARNEALSRWNNERTPENRRALDWADRRVQFAIQRMPKR